ncbi:UNVERIFIED_ORG: 2,4-dienoyl-CoA reductase-like NADH-dependent reductase (Old Yellow Enzyme family) [Kosakonia oryzae]|uniref:2,4-dienoyl-CoA reductase n=1 Tax=Kosakonia radicincitans TaxID=283686 RepID=A0AAX2EM01_9ENTR|nr:NADH:flavin oxidoreductase/NADH oxidase [Kosakonia radicincitans]MDP9564945.1 2,4-dienoyl-CoA reductase-like NADH-dependent reductase (Old Yellow Enzyme family) [Kosakonia oryzae]SFD93034.1 2,4-dienoyl-CoA reductase [Kosakonia radicincitans]SFQ97724.1 2,4-dienoyl-CoA reductase [Kosakonia radicincitans]SFT40846.1 2,4-dienoyl-CoA reductase [Kosakonia radicincitans]SFX10451.1 2,4-dienoyl-CoA reductase [Kosakonia radicincitans]
MSQLFTQANVGSVALDNRIVIAPMCQYSADAGKATAWHRIHLGNLALSGAGLLIIEATAVEPEGRISPQDLGLWDDETQQALRVVLDDIRQYSPIKMGIQLGHAGRKASVSAPWLGGKQLSLEEGGWQTISASSVPHDPGERPPREMSQQDLQRVKQRFVDSARRAVALGIEVIEIHAAHGYLLHQFLSPLSNQRTDEYGGSLENRLRFTLEVFSAVRETVPSSVAVGIRISATDWIEGGWDLEQSIVLTKEIEAAGGDYVHVSSGGLSPLQSIKVSAGYQVPFAKALRQQTTMPVIAVGLITEPQHAEEILQQGDADLIALARGALYDPRWPWHAAAALHGAVHVAPQYRRAEPHGVKGTVK